MSGRSDDGVLRPGDNCWLVSRADRFGWAVDGADYFAALRESFDKARQEILIVGWDIDSRVQLIRDEAHPKYPSPLCETLQALVERKPELCVHILSWDFAMIYVLERELLPAYSFGWQDSERLHFQLDGKHATGASQHQKLVVIDGQVAFIGGIDITRARWDRSAHASDDPGRVDPLGNAYGPFHDIQALLAGPAAERLRELVSFRWENATGEKLPELDAATGPESDAWPWSLNVRMEDAEIGLARTWVDPSGTGTTHEVETLYADMISAARRSIYIENQYFTAPSIAEKLAERLREAEGPEIVIVLPSQTSGWLEQSTMDVLRNSALGTLASADEHGRLRIVSPVNDELGDESINVHAKLMIVDDDWLRIGSANLSRRSMGLDSECDVVVDTRGSDAARHLRAELLAEHLGSGFEAVLEAVEARGLLGAIDSLNDGERRLDPLDFGTGDGEQILEPLARIADLEKPVERAWQESIDELGYRFSDIEWKLPDALGGAERKEGGATDGGDGDVSTPRTGWLFIGGVAAVLAFWVFLVLQGSSEGFTLQDLLAELRSLAAHPLAPVVALPAIVLGSLLVAPITGMVALCALLFDPFVAATVSILGTLLSTVVNHRIGSHFAEVVSSRIPAAVSRRIDRAARSSDTWSLAGLRLIPIAPFTIVNLAVGVAGVPLRPFLLGTLIAMGPGILLICFSVDRARAALQGEPVFDPWTAGIIVLAGIGLVTLRILKNRGRS